MKQIIKKSILVASMALVSSYALANSSMVVGDFESRMINSAKKVEIPAKDFLIASQLLERLYDENVVDKPHFDKLNSFDEYQQIVSLVGLEDEVPAKLRADLKKIMNEQQSKLASYLLLDVSKLDAFLKEYDSQHSRKSSVERDMSIQANNGLERINVTCTDCNSPHSVGYFDATAFIHDRGQPFIKSGKWGATVSVTFTNSKTRRVFAKEIWRVTNTNAWMLKEQPCDECSVGD